MVYLSFRVLATNVETLEDTPPPPPTDEIKIEEKVKEVKVEEKPLIQKTVEKQIEENVGGASEHFFSMTKMFLSGNAD